MWFWTKLICAKHSPCSLNTCLTARRVASLFWLRSRSAFFLSILTWRLASSAATVSIRRWSCAVSSCVTRWQLLAEITLVHLHWSSVSCASVGASRIRASLFLCLSSGCSVFTCHDEARCVLQALLNLCDLELFGQSCSPHFLQVQKDEVRWKKSWSRKFLALASNFCSQTACV